MQANGAPGRESGTWARGRVHAAAWTLGLAALMGVERADAVEPPTPGEATPVCTARLRAAFHLRPRAVVRSLGLELPAGTEVAVLATSSVQRPQREWGGALAPVLSRVRVIATGVEGYAFVDPRELTPTCPLLTPIGAMTRSLRDRIGHQWRVNYGREWGVAPVPVTQLTGWGLAFDPARDEVLARFDVDHNGSEEVLIRANPENNLGAVLALMRGTGARATGIVVEQEWDHDHHSIRYGQTIRAGRDTYVAMHTWDVGGCNRCLDAVCEQPYWDLRRLHPDGWFVRTATLPRQSEGEALSLHGEADGRVTVEGELTHRRQSLRFDPTTFALVIEGPSMPELAMGEDFCRQPPER